jgi:hypothetical protein
VSVRCPEHDQYAHITASGSTTSNMEFKVSGCCEELVEEVEAKLKG